MITLRKQIGQMLIMGFAGTSIDEQSPIANWLDEYNLGGVLLFDYDLMHKRPGKNLNNPSQIRQLTRQLQHYAQHIFPFIAIDYEGGAVDRLRGIEGCLTTKKPDELALLSDFALEQEIRKMAETLNDLGFNLNFAPVVDLNLNQQTGIIGQLGRSFSACPNEVIRVAKKFVKIFAEQGITCSYKHFPGHGSAKEDTHYGFVDVSDTFQENELKPYSVLLDKNEPAAMVMTAHVINRKLDKSGLPATLSQSMLTGLLRQQWGYEGVIISDDLQMHAIANHFSLEDTLRLTINAGADMLIFANQLGQITAPCLIDEIEKMVQAKLISRERIAQAYQRITALKQKQLTTA